MAVLRPDRMLQVSTISTVFWRRAYGGKDLAPTAPENAKERTVAAVEISKNGCSPYVARVSESQDLPKVPWNVIKGAMECRCGVPGCR